MRNEAPGMTRTASRVDTNHAEIVSALRQVGCSVLSLAALGGGVPDLLVAKGGTTVLIEIKQGKGKLNKQQKDWHANWKGAVYVVNSPQAAWAVMCETSPR